MLFLVVTNLETKDQTTFIVRRARARRCICDSPPALLFSRAQIDRHNTYREITGIYLPHHENPVMPLRSSLIDGELVIDVDPATHQVRGRLPAQPPAHGPLACALAHRA